MRVELLVFYGELSVPVYLHDLQENRVALNRLLQVIIILTAMFRLRYDSHVTTR